MRTSQNTKISKNLQEDLVRYGILRKEAAKEAPLDIESPNLFGIRSFGTEDKVVFKDKNSYEPLTESGVQISVLAPDIEPFDMLVTKDFSKAVEKADSKTLREYIARLLDEV